MAATATAMAAATTTTTTTTTMHSYVYSIMRGFADPFQRPFVWELGDKRALDVEAMRQAAKFLLGEWEEV
jgi:hypothetical protein